MTRKRTRKLAPTAASSLGEHIKHVRQERGLLQRDVAALIGVTPDTIHNWEAGKTRPPIAAMPAIFRFLGYDPHPQPTTLSERMLAYRRRNGLSIEIAAKRLDVDASTWGEWERTGIVKWTPYLEALEAVLVVAV